MKGSDIGLSLFILFVFVVLSLVSVLSVGIKKVQEDWPTYRCNPAVMPFASVFGQDAGTNFTYCIQTMQSSYMDYLLQPMNYNLGVMGGLGGEISGAVNSARYFIDNLRNMITTVVQSIFGVFLNILIEFQRMIIALKDIIGKMVGTLAVLMYTLDGSILTMNSTWNGAPGQMVRALCFHPDTLLQLETGKFVAMKDIPLNSRLKNGAIVQSVMRLSNVDGEGEQVEDMYAMIGENETTMFVTGSHLIFDNVDKVFTSVKEFSNRLEERKEGNKCKKVDLECPELSCLITSNHSIPIGTWIFHDWEDNNGSPSKSL